MSDSPQDWQLPIWHPDFGDSATEFKELQSLAVAVSEAIPQVHTTLDIPEPGYLNVRIELPNGLTVEVHSILGSHRNDERRFGVFVSPDSEQESENYFESLASVVDFLSIQARE